MFVYAGSTWLFLTKSSNTQRSVCFLFLNFVKNAPKSCVTVGFQQPSKTRLSCPIMDPRAKAEALRLAMPSGYARPSTFGAGGFHCVSHVALSHEFGRPWWMGPCPIAVCGSTLCFAQGEHFWRESNRDTIVFGMQIQREWLGFDGLIICITEISESPVIVMLRVACNHAVGTDMIQYWHCIYGMYIGRGIHSTNTIKYLQIQSNT